MMRFGLLLALSIVLAGCTGSGSTFSEAPGSIAPGDQRFALTVRVMSLEDPTVAIVGAIVSAGGATGTMLTGTTDTTGQAILDVASPQVISVEAHAEGYVDTATAGIRLGPTTADAGRPRTSPSIECGATLGIVCGNDRDITTRLAGTEARITIRMIPDSVVREIDVPIEASASPPTQTTTYSATVAFASDQDARDIYVAHLRHIDGALAWTNGPGAAADLDFGLACPSTGTLTMTDEGGPQTLATIGARELKLSTDVTARCEALIAEVEVNSVTTDIVPHATFTLSFRPALQRPLTG